MGLEHQGRKIGKHQTLPIKHPEFGVDYGTVNAENLHSVYIDLISNISSSEFMTNEELLSLHSSWKLKIRRILYGIPNKYFQDYSIIDFNEYSSNIPANKQIYLITEIILYNKYQFDIKEPEVVALATDITNKIIEMFKSTENIFFSRKRIPNGKLETNHL
jgi:hypothetical protein